MDPKRLGEPSGGFGREACRETVTEIADSLVATADPRWGGWGARQKFPHPDALHFLLVRWAATGEQSYLDTVRRTLRSMQQRGIHDTVEGGFYRFSAKPDWTAPDTEKPLLCNAKRLGAYAEAFQALGEESFRGTARGIASWMLEALKDRETGAFLGGQDASDAYAAMDSIGARRALDAPQRDPLIYGDRNGWAAIGLLKAGNALGAPELVDAGVRALDFVCDGLLGPDGSVGHYWNGARHQPGCLQDQGAVLRALVEAVHITGDVRFLEPALRIAHWTLQSLGADDGTFRSDPYGEDRPAAARTADELRSHAVFAEALLRLSVLTGAEEFHARGEAALLAFVPHWRPHGFAGAGFGRALDLLVHPPIHVIVLGPKDDLRTAELHREALRPFVASRVVQVLEWGQPGPWPRAWSAPDPGGAPIAMVRRGGHVTSRTEDPERLAELIAGADATS